MRRSDPNPDEAVHLAQDRASRRMSRAMAAAVAAMAMAAPAASAATTDQPSGDRPDAPPPAQQARG
jgi:hypothetical protein